MFCPACLLSRPGLSACLCCWAFFLLFCGPSFVGLLTCSAQKKKAAIPSHPLLTTLSRKESGTCPPFFLIIVSFFLLVPSSLSLFFLVLPCKKFNKFVDQSRFCTNVEEDIWKSLSPLTGFSSLFLPYFSVRSGTIRKPETKRSSQPFLESGEWKNLQELTLVCSAVLSMWLCPSSVRQKKILHYI